MQSVLVFLSLLQACTYYLSPSTMPAPSFNSLQSEAFRVAAVPAPSPAVEFDLSNYQWRHRVALIFAPSERSPTYQQQMQAWQANTAGTLDRHLKLVEVLGRVGRADGQFITPASVERLRQRFGVTTEDFAVILVGKDGTEKQRNQAPINPIMLFRVIDAMPMRQQEMRSQP